MIPVSKIWHFPLLQPFSREVVKFQYIPTWTVIIDAKMRQQAVFGKWLTSKWAFKTLCLFACHTFFCQKKKKGKHGLDEFLTQPLTKVADSLVLINHIVWNVCWGEGVTTCYDLETAGVHLPREGKLVVPPWSVSPFLVCCILVPRALCTKE